MKNIILPVITLVSVAAFFAACKPKSPPPATPSADDETARQQMDQQANQAVAANQNSTADLQGYGYDQKDEFVAKMKTQLSGVNDRLNQISQQVDSAGDAAKASAEPKLQALRDQAAKLNQQLDAAGDATESTWESAKAGAITAYQGLQDGIRQSRQWLSDKIAP
jgi:chromosome segregation ATPase